MQRYIPDFELNRERIISLIRDLAKSKESFQKLAIKYPMTDGKILSKSVVLYFYKKLVKVLFLDKEEKNRFLEKVVLKKVRTVSGVTPVTVLTKPFPCPGKCIFCPNDVRMPKSYISSEPGAQRAAKNNFDPYFQTYNRLVAYYQMGHPTDKVEIIILGGTWTVYPKEYQIWFVKRCFDALNEFDPEANPIIKEPPNDSPIDESFLEEIKGEVLNKSYNQVVARALSAKLVLRNNEVSTWEDLFEVQKVNEKAKTRCVGLVVETRPDEITKDEVVNMRRLGATKVQIGIQSLSDTVLEKNKRGHDVFQTRNAINLLRHAGFKIHAHWMPNLYGSTPEKDISDFKKLFSDINIRPDELKVYPCSLVSSAELMQVYKKGLWRPYTYDELTRVLIEVYKNAKNYCRLTRVVRDIPGNEIVVGNKITNIRQDIEGIVRNLGLKTNEIRSREVRDSAINPKIFKIQKTTYKTGVSKEIFLEFVDNENRIAAFLRLSLPTVPSFIAELKSCAIIREVHVYGQSIQIGKKEKGSPQHFGFGTQLIKTAILESSKAGFSKIAVISSVGTREYYRRLGFEDAKLYQIYSIKKAATLP